MKRGRPPILNDIKIAAALTKAKGNVTVVADQFDVSRAAIQKRIAASKHLAEVLADARESMIDKVESRFQADCLKDEPHYQTSRIFFLKTQGKSRGYVERQELTGADGDAVSLKIVKEIVIADGDETNPTAPGSEPIQ